MTDATPASWRARRSAACGSRTISESITISGASWSSCELRVGGGNTRGLWLEVSTSASHSGASERSIMKQTGHRSTAMVRRYIHEAELFHDNAAGKLGL